MIEHEISLLEALTGVDFVITHLDGKKIRIKNNPGEVIKPEDIKTVEGYGMPFHKMSYKTGNLFVLFKVRFPDSLKENQVKGIAEALKSNKKQKDVDMSDAEVCPLLPFSEAHKNVHHEGGAHGQGDSDDDDDEGHHGGQRVKCAQQ